MKIFVSGGTGYIGSHLIAALAKEGHQIHAYCRSKKKAEFIEHDQVQLFYGDLDNLESLKEAMEGCEIVFHLAAFAKVWSANSGDFYRINVDGTRNVLDMARTCSVRRVVFTSTGGVYGASFGEAITERYVRKKDFFNEYEGSKCLAESWVKEYVIAGLDVVIVSPTRVYGPYLFGNPESITRLMYSFVKGNWRWIPGPADKLGNYVYIDDVVDGHIKAMEKGNRGETYILGGTNHSYTEFFSVLKRESGIKRRLFPLPLFLIYGVAYISLGLAKMFSITPSITPKWVAKARYHWEVNPEKAKNELGMKVTPFDEGIRRTVNWLRS